MQERRGLRLRAGGHLQLVRSGRVRRGCDALASEVKPSVPLSSQNEIGVCPRPSQAGFVAALPRRARI
jgi:hypothetical protein